MYQETFVERDGHRIYVREYSGEEPAIILMHGFPDNVHLHDRLVPISRHFVQMDEPAEVARLILDMPR